MTSPSSPFQETVYDTEVPQKTVEVKDLKVREIMKKLLGGNKCKVLDVGCGDGSLLGPFCSFQECYGVDVSEAQLKQAEMRGIRTYHTDLESEELPFGDECFDLIVCSETIEHLLDADNLLHEIHRTLRLGGTFILTFPNVNQPISWLMQILFDLPPRFSARYKSPHVRDYTLRIVRMVLASFGFEIANVTGTYVYPFEGKFSQWVAASFPRLGEKIIVVSEKHRKTLVTRPKAVVWNVMELFRRRVGRALFSYQIRLHKPVS
jgi:methionine biosynthesis protein MetW